MSILSSQADPPTLKNLDFALAGARLRKNQGLRSKDVLDKGFGALLGSFLGALGGFFGAMFVLLRALGGTLSF